MRVPSVLLLVAACGGSSAPKTPQDLEREAATAQRKQLESERPKLENELRQRVAFRPPERCGQGPYRIELPALATKFNEEFRVYACGVHDIAGNYRYSVHADGKAPRTVTESAFGFGDRENAACKADRGSSAQLGGEGGVEGQVGDLGGSAPVAPDSSPSASKSSSSKSSSSKSSSSKSSSSKSSSSKSSSSTAMVEPAATLKTVALERVTTAIPSSCGARVEIINMTHTSEGDYVPVEGRLVLDVWSEVPNDYEDMIFVVEQYGLVADMTKERWTAYREAERAWRVRYHAYLDGEVSKGRMTVVDTKVTAPPPPPPRDETKPPRPSKNARWITGYWLYVETKFHWITGLWEVPDSDIEQELTVAAPKPPPPAPPPTVEVEIEKPPVPTPPPTATATVTVSTPVPPSATVWVEKPAEPRPTATAVWTGGHWQWDGRAYIWIHGAWRIPPSPQSTWAPARWSLGKRGGAIFVPGRWSVGPVRVRERRR